ncbi:MAG: GC-type dockerin domain-anchored protein [Planctomycetota bacterium]
MGVFRVSAIVAAAGVGLPAVGQVDRVLASGADEIRVAGHVYQVGGDRVILSADRTPARRAGEVRVWEHQEPLFDTLGTGQCSDAVSLYGLMFPDTPGNEPAYEAWEATARVPANSTIDLISFTASALLEPGATLGDGIDDAVPFNDWILIIEDAENAIDDISTPTLQRFPGLAVLDLAGDDSPVAGNVSVFFYTIDLSATDGGLDGAFELGDDNGAAEEACVGDSFNAYSFSGIDSRLHDATYTMFFLQPTADFSRQIDPQNAEDRLDIVPQGTLTGIGGGWLTYDPADAVNSFPDIDAQVPGFAVGSLDTIRIWDLTVPPADGGADFSQSPWTPEWLDETGGADTAGVRIAPQSRIDFFDANSFIEDEIGLTAFDIVCNQFSYTSRDGSTTVAIGAKSGSEPYIGLRGPVPGSCIDCPDSICPCTGLTPCSAADIAPPFGVNDLGDIDLFIQAFALSDVCADLVSPFGIVDLSDVDAFLRNFLSGCP